ncbi:OmpR family two-component system bacitracin resistance sensor histidine kinase BceS [Natranaerovirga hydrolytica]|uniref:histidine kinase n=1 Tax=Natranaerovirga hydrolytica TaxID=680378 RepID=A0A4R1N507_9FIRM|nr:sensor histidine kinase [Natranaerovirga hydrolytica]TCK98039.1 OmpR family two-component system bacitracin resistance sensor histidine kinase BceS [Natranaerovirga hydrolytica]
MIKKFLMERISWIILIVLLPLLALILAYLDPALSIDSIFYYVFLSLVISFLFVFIRYFKETSFYKELALRDSTTDITSLPEPNSSFESFIYKQITSSIEQLEKDASTNRLLLEQEKDDLLSWIHEVKTPLTALKLIIDRSEDHQLKSDLMHEWLRIHYLLDQQLHQKRIPFIENDLFIEKVELESLLYSEIHTLRSWCLKKGIGFDVELNSTHVLTDGKWLSFILRQLLTNAVKYSEEGSEITIQSVDKVGQTILTVADNGRGIDPRDVSRIFDKGFTSTSKYQDQHATGMGLYLAKKAAIPLGIRISIQSILGKGTTVTLTFSKENQFLQIQGV